MDVAHCTCGGAARRLGAAYPESVEEKAAICGACHGLKGVPEDKSTPIIWGQNAGYLYLQFRDFQKGARTAEPMASVAKNVVKEDALALAEYFAAKPWPNIGAPAASKADADIAKTAIKSVVCTSCHLEQFQGDFVRSPPRRARSATISYKTMMDFRDRTRANNPGMSDLMNTITPEQIAAIASYLAGL